MGEIIERAIEEALFAFDHLKADCVKIASNSSGLCLGDEKLEPLMKVLNEREAVIITHPHRPEPINETLVENMPLPVSEYLAETTRAIINMLSRNVLARYSQLRSLCHIAERFFRLRYRDLKRCFQPC